MFKDGRPLIDMLGILGTVGKVLLLPSKLFKIPEAVNGLAASFVFKLFFAVSFRAKVLLVKTHRSNALTADCGTTPCEVDKCTVRSISGTKLMHNGHRVFSSGHMTLWNSLRCFMYSVEGMTTPQREHCRYCDEYCGPPLLPSFSDWVDVGAIVGGDTGSLSF